MMFCWDDMELLVTEFDNALRDDDLEMVGYVRQDIYERILKALMADILEDRDKIFAVLPRIMEVKTRWQ